MDDQPRRFGWRYWHIHDEGTRLFGPIDGAPARFGRSFATSKASQSRHPPKRLHCKRRSSRCGASSPTRILTSLRSENSRTTMRTFTRFGVRLV